MSATHSHIQPSDFRLCHSVIKTFNVDADLHLQQQQHGRPVCPGAEHCFAGAVAFHFLADPLVITSTEVCPSRILSFFRRFIGSHNCKLKAKNISFDSVLTWAIVFRCTSC